MIVCQARWVVPSATNSRSVATSRGPGALTFSPRSRRAARIAWSELVSRPPAARVTNRLGIGDPVMVSNRPDEVTAARRPCPKTSSPSKVCVQAR